MMNKQIIRHGERVSSFEHIYDIMLIGTRAQRFESRPLWQHNHFAVADLMFRKDLRTGFRMYFNFCVRKARLDRLDRLDFVGNGDKK